MFLYCNSLAKQENRVRSRECPRLEGKGHTGLRFYCSWIKHQMLSTSREQVKTQGNKDERGEKHALGSSGEVGLRAGEVERGRGVKHSI